MECLEILPCSSITIYISHGMFRNPALLLLRDLHISWNVSKSCPALPSWSTYLMECLEILPCSSITIYISHVMFRNPALLHHHDLHISWNVSKSCPAPPSRSTYLKECFEILPCPSIMIYISHGMFRNRALLLHQELHISWNVNMWIGVIWCRHVEWCHLVPICGVVSCGVYMWGGVIWCEHVRWCHLVSTCGVV